MFKMTYYSYGNQSVRECPNFVIPVSLFVIPAQAGIQKFLFISKI